ATRDDHGGRDQSGGDRPHRHPGVRRAGGLPAARPMARSTRRPLPGRRSVPAARRASDHRRHAFRPGHRRGVAARARAATGNRRQSGPSMTTLEKALVNLSSILVGLSGVVYAWMKYLMTTDDPYAVVNHPLQPWVLDLHLIAAPILVFSIGLIFMDHVAA